MNGPLDTLEPSGAPWDHPGGQQSQPLTGHHAWGNPSTRDFPMEGSKPCWEGGEVLKLPVTFFLEREVQQVVVEPSQALPGMENSGNVEVSGGEMQNCLGLAVP